MRAIRLPPQDGTFGTSTFTFPSARVFVRIARFTRICWIARTPRDFVKRSCANSNGTNRVGGLENAAPCFVHRQFTSAAVRRRHLILRKLELLLRGFHERLDLSQLIEWTIEANPGSVSARKAALLKKFGVNRISLGVQSWDEELLKLLGREHNAQQAKQSFRILRNAGFTNVNVDLMFGLPSQTADQWRATLEKTIALEPEHISTYCLTYEEDTEFFLRHARGEFRQDADADAEFFEITMAILEDAGYRHYEISNYARPGFESVHNRAYWLGKDYLGIGPSAVSTIGIQRWQNVCDYRVYIERVFSGESPHESTENLTDEMKRTERIALALRTRDGVSASELKDFAQEVGELIGLELLRESNGNFVLTPKGKALADSVAEAFL